MKQSSSQVKKPEYAQFWTVLVAKGSAEKIEKNKRRLVDSLQANRSFSSNNWSFLDRSVERVATSNQSASPSPPNPQYAAKDMENVGENLIETNELSESDRSESFF